VRLLLLLAVFTSMILLTYRAHWSPIQMLELLIFRYHMQPPKKYMSLSELGSWNSSTLEPVQTAVTSVLAAWIERYFKQDMEENATLISLLLNVVDTMYSGNTAPQIEGRRLIKLALCHNVCHAPCPNRPAARRIMLTDNTGCVDDHSCIQRNSSCCLLPRASQSLKSSHVHLFQPSAAISRCSTFIPPRLHDN
jgi:hypothetical protein